MSGLSLYKIEASLEELHFLREEAIAMGDFEQLAVADKLILEYAEERRPAKIDSCAWLGKFNGGLDMWHKLSDKLISSIPVPDNNAIREILSQRIPCPECWDTATGQRIVTANICTRCEGVGTIPANVPGARLLPRAEHVVIR